MSVKKRQRLAFLMKLLITALIFLWIINGVDLSLLRERADRLSLSTILICIAALVFQSFIAAARLRLLTAYLGTKVSAPVSWKLTMTGLFFNQVLPSTIGGDAIKVWLLAQSESWSMRASVHCIVIDRALGLLALLTVICLTVPLVITTIPDGQATTNIIAVVILVAVGSIVFLLMPRLPDRVERTRVVTELRQLRDALRSIFCNASVCGLSGLYGVMMYLLNVALIWYIATDVGIAVKFAECLVVVPAALMISFVPVSIAGWGLREGAMIAGFGYVGMAATDALFLSVTLGVGMTLVGLLGGAVWLATRPDEITAAATNVEKQSKTGHQSPITSTVEGCHKTRNVNPVTCDR